jgi:hypothetical protein
LKHLIVTIILVLFTVSEPACYGQYSGQSPEQFSRQRLAIDLHHLIGNELVMSALPESNEDQIASDFKAWENGTDKTSPCLHMFKQAHELTIHFVKENQEYWKTRGNQESDEWERIQEEGHVASALLNRAYACTNADQFGSNSNDLIPPAPPRSGATCQPTFAPQRPPLQPLVLRGKAVTEEHFKRVTRVISNLPPNIQQFIRRHRIRIIATDTVVGEHPEWKHVHPADYPKGWTWENSDGIYVESRNDVIVASQWLVKDENKWKPSLRVDSIARHETAHAIDLHMGYFSQNNREFIGTYNREAKKLPASVLESLWYILRPDGRGQQEAFAELFATLYGGAAQGPQNQRLMETHFHDTLEVVRKAMNLLR